MTVSDTMRGRTGDGTGSVRAYRANHFKTDGIVASEQNRLHIDTFFFDGTIVYFFLLQTHDGTAGTPIRLWSHPGDLRRPGYVFYRSQKMHRHEYASRTPPIQHYFMSIRSSTQVFPRPRQQEG